MMALASITLQAPGDPAMRRETSRFDQRLQEILKYAADVFYEKGYAGASMRDLSRASGISLAGLYHYVESKERMLYLIQKHTFSTILGGLNRRLQAVEDADERVRVVIQNHLEYFLANQKAMKVLSHEEDVLSGEYGREIDAIKREYYRTCVDLLEELKRERKLTFTSRVAVLSLFGMMNWIYTWYHPGADSDADTLAREMGDIFLQGIEGAKGAGK